MRRSTIIIGIAVVLVLTGAIVLLNFWPENNNEIEEPQPTPPQETLYADLISVDFDDVTEVIFKPQSGSQYTLRPVPESEENEIELDTADAVFPGDPFLLQSAFFFSTVLRNLYIITDNADDNQLALFGLDDPVMTWQVVTNDGTSVEAIVGAQQAAGDNRYVSLKGSRQVFLINDAQSFSLTLELEDLYDISFFPYPPSTEEAPTWTLIDHAEIETENGVMEFRRRTIEELESGGIGTSTFQLLQPFTGECNDYVIQNEILELITFITPHKIVSIRPTNLSAYGLDNPDRVSISTEEWSGTLLIGGRDLENGGRYIMIEGYDAVLNDFNADYSFLNINPSRLRVQLMWLFDIAEISSVDFDLDGISRTLLFEHDHENKSLRGWLDDKEISETNARRLYMGTLSITQSGSTDAAIPNIQPSYRVKINFTEKDDQVLELFQINDSQFLIVINDTSTGFYITRMILQQNLLNRFDLLDAGRDIP